MGTEPAESSAVFGFVGAQRTSRRLALIEAFAADRATRRPGDALVGHKEVDHSETADGVVDRRGGANTNSNLADCSTPKVKERDRASGSGLEKHTRA